MRIAGAKKRRLIGQDEPGEQEPILDEEQPEEASSIGGRPSPAAIFLNRGPGRPRSAMPRVRRRKGGNKSGDSQSSAANKLPGLAADFQTLSSTNVFGLESRSEQFYPEAFKPVSRAYWAMLTDEERKEQIRLQVSIKEKLYFEEKPGAMAGMTRTQVEYQDRVHMRSRFMRRRRKIGHRDKKREEEERRKMPLTRRYVPKQMEYFVPSQFAQMGPLDSPVLVGELQNRMRRSGPQPVGRLKSKKTRIGKASQPDDAGVTAKLPKLDPALGQPVVLDRWRNRFGLKPRSVTSYPEAFKEVSSVFWRRPGKEFEAAVLRMQAVAMEKVGFERGTEKQFIEDFDPTAENVYGIAQNEDIRPARWVSFSLVFGILLIIGGAVATLYALSGERSPPLLTVGILAILAGIVIAVPSQTTRRMR